MTSGNRTSSIRVAIVGGGPSGLTLACILKAIHIPFTVFELDASRHARSQGGMLDIHKHSGQLALAKAGLLDEFKRRMRVHATDFYLRDHTGKVLWFRTEREVADPERPEIDRAELRNMLLGPLDEEDVKWGKKFVRAEKVDGTEAGSNFVLHFGDGSTAGGFNVLVGADGTWSKVRPLRSNVPPPYVGVTVITTSIAKLDESFPDLGKFVGSGSSMLVDGNSAVIAQKSGDGTVKTYSFIPVPEDWKEQCGIDWSNQKKGLMEFVERFHSNWAEEAKALLVECDEGDLAIRPLYLYPSGHKLKKACSGVTLIGDAAHVITPFTGTGVNNAMHDAYELGQALEEVAFDGANVDKVLQSFEETMLERVAFWSDKSLENQKATLGGKPVHEILEHFAKVY
ncbi:hypothetical protein NMY22_g12628 [Coprinellus aureogranulatus]|nr:hypothetical protein NMY22_g12628 [Coprinellus aureogranulatus]